MTATRSRAVCYTNVQWVEENEGQASDFAMSQRIQVRLNNGLTLRASRVYHPCG